MSTTVQDGAATPADAPRKKSAMDGFNSVLVKVGRAVGGVVGVLYQAGRDTIEAVLRNILPFMAFISVIVGFVTYTGIDGAHQSIGDVLANFVAPLASSLLGLLALCIFCAIPILSPVLGPGAVIAQVIGVLLGTRIGAGDIPPQYALPALFAIDPQVGCDFIPVGLALGDAEPETVEVGVPAVLFSRLLTGPISVVIAYFASFGMYSSN